MRRNRDALLACGVRRVRRCASSSGRGRSPSEKIHNRSRCRHVASQAFVRASASSTVAGRVLTVDGFGHGVVAIVHSSNQYS